MFLSLALPILFWYFIGITALCHNNCNSNGICSKWGTCECWEGWEGNACEKRSCPSGIQLSSIPYASNQAHSRKTCSGQGECDHTSGTCKCNNGYAGIDCSRTLCFNDCSGRGSCISLRTAAVDNDGYFLNRTSTYNLWDADVIFGCQCDFGWSGPDCSERSCPSGPDPRLSSSSREQVKLVCQCDSECSGRFKLRYKGITTRKWLYPTSRAFEVADSIMAIPGVYSNNSAQTFIPIVAINATVDDLICKAASTTVTNIQFRRDAGDLPSLSFYGKRIVGGQIFFRVRRIIVLSLQR